ncbi:MAG: hypothetical protein WCZ01_01245 [Candidatus Neomarinimicrobiota bacterium]|jgi:hypothetical protein
MFGWAELKKKIEVEGDTIICPIIGCKNQVRKMTKSVPKSLDAYLGKGEDDREKFDQYLCKEHKIYITPTTFIYEDLRDNLLWYDADKDLLDEIMKVKRVKAQLHHDASEDAVTWNVFRFLERNKLLSGFLEGLHNSLVKSPEVIYWSYSQSQQKVWNELEKARAKFGESPQRSSEPDLVVKSNDILFFIETKLTAPNKIDFNKNHTAEDRAERVRRYSKGDYFLNQPVENIMDAGYYQLMRFWLIGALIADNENLNFYLLNLVRKNEEKDIESEFGKYIKQNEKREFMKVTWEDIYKYISNTDLLGEEKDKMSGYFRNKTIGYNGNEELQKAFSIP